MRRIIGQLIIGTAKFQSLSIKKIGELLTYVASQPTAKFDVAPTYRSESIVGGLQNSSLGITANSKFSVQVEAEITRDDVARQLLESERQLNHISDYFLHSSDPDLLSEGAWDFLQGAKRDGRIERIGFAGDGEQLSKARADFRFEVFQSTFSIVDQGNLANLRAIESEGRGLQLKRVLGSGLLSKRPLAGIRRKISPPALFSYRYRLEHLQSHLKPLGQLTVRDFFQFVAGVFPEADLVVGVSDAEGLREIQVALSQLANLEPSYVGGLDPYQLIDLWSTHFLGTPAEIPTT